VENWRDATAESIGTLKSRSNAISTIWFAKDFKALTGGLQCRRRVGKQSMARNFGVPQHISRSYRPSLWPLLAVTFIMVGMIDVATHLRHW
jgi:hypothetical protein